MGEFLHIVLSMPTVVFSLLLVAVVGYWLLAATGLLDLDLFGGGESAGGGPGDVTGIGMRLGFGGLPISLVGSVVVLIGWGLSVFLDEFVLHRLPPAWPLPVTASASLLVTLAIALPLAGVVLRPLRGVFAQLHAGPRRSFVGEEGVVRSPTVDAAQGWATVEDGGAGLVLQVRDAAPERFRRGDRIVLVEYLADQNAYRIDAAREA